MADQTNYVVTINDIDHHYRRYVRTVKADMIKPGDAVKKVLDLIERSDDHWLWKVRGLSIEVEAVS